MSFLTSLLFGRPAAPTETKVVNADALTWASLLGSAGASKTGLTVSEASALRVATVYACCRVICEDIGKLPLKVMRDEGEKKGSSPQRQHPLYRLLARRPNEWQTSMEWRMTQLLHALTGKGGYSFISRQGNVADGPVVELIPMLPGSVCVKQADDWSIYYEWTNPSGRTVKLQREFVHALHGLSWDGVSAMPAIQQAREAIGLSMATEETQARLHGQGARPGGIVTTTAKLSTEEAKNIKDTFAQGYTGVENAFRTILLDNGLEFKPWSQSGVDGQHLENRKYQVEEVCRYFRVFPSMIGFSDKAATYASAESFFGAHVTHTLMPWFVLWEQAMERDLLSEEDVAGGVYVKFFAEGLLRGKSSERAAYYKAGINDGWLTRNEARRLEDLNPLPGLDEPLSPMNLQGGAPKPEPESPEPVEPDEDDADPEE